MRLLNVILTALFAVFALVAGLFAAAVVALAGAALLLMKRFRRSGPAISAMGNPSPTRARSSPASGDVIEISATEVVADPVETAQR